MKPTLYRYRDSESVIKAMEGYTPGEGWEPIYDQATLDAAVADMRERGRLAMHDAVMASLDEAGIYAEVLRGMCVEVALERFDDAIRKG